MEPHRSQDPARPTYSAETEKIGSLGPNEAAYVDGWVRGNVAYQTNPPPWNSDVYFHLHDGRGWVTFAGIRTLPTTFDPTGLDPDGGPEVPLYAECEGVSR